MPGTSKIVIENNDQKIWRKDKVLLDLVQAMYRGDLVEIELHSEGPCAQSLGLYDLLDDLCARTNFDKKNIQIKTCNLLETHKEYHIQNSPPFKHIRSLQKNLVDQGFIYSKNFKDLKHFGHFIGHGSRYRLVIASWLWKHHKDKTLQTFHTTPQNDLHREFVALEDLWFHDHGLDHVMAAVEFLQHTPLRFDHQDSGPILHMKMYGILDAYPKIFLDIVCNTYVTGKTFFLDEKIWRPIITKTPFIVHGPQNFLQNLKKLGFKTFDQWWDEGHSEDPPDYQAHEILDLLEKISQWDVTRLEKTYQDMQPVLDHNYDLFLQLHPLDFLRAFTND